MSILTNAAGAATQDIPTATANVAKDTGHVAKKTAGVSVHRTETGVKKTGEANAHAVVETRKGVRMEVNRLGHGIKKASTTTADASNDHRR